ncbi:hypothetical protein L1049_001587 [Liquidambar formosana]|uniref:Uncharacterized protein n=1 Tax=Liquidambar formosana TaxID=63359 RepID=A0AAP0N5U3_LIQFO
MKTPVERRERGQSLQKGDQARRQQHASAKREKNKENVDKELHQPNHASSQMFSSVKRRCLRTGGRSGGELLAREESEGMVEAVIREKLGWVWSIEKRMGVGKGRTTPL